MENIKKIAQAFEGEDSVVLICSKSLGLKIDDELANLKKEENSYVSFENTNKTNFGFNSVFIDGINIHYASDFEKFVSKI